ncbi:MAG: preprotein translocase subunit SecA, partial [SAR202 cluster bacterium]|nr:preprotein translocase subunit SecA [SAR202 cluster bacterium]
ISKVESALKIKNIYDPSNFGMVQFLENALKAHIIFHRDTDYVVKDGEVIIVDEFTGRMMPGRRFSEGLHQALEAKEGVKVQRESITYATITLQNYFRLYSKLSGMTGTAMTEAEEFWKIYKLDVVEIPTNKAMVRKDHTDLIFMNTKGKWRAVAGEIEELHKKGQPVLVGTTDIAKSELLSDLLRKRGVPHEVLNAKNHEREAQIVSQAGRPGAVTVATNMAGRGTDIILGGSPDADEKMSREEWQREHDKVIELGGLHIIGTERHEARRVDNQLRGRAGRQGDPGSSRFYVALDDDLMKRFAGERIQSVMSWTGIDEDTAIENRMVSKSIESAQVKVEAFHFDMRKHLVDYDDVVNKHRDIIYSERNKILQGADLKANVVSMVEKELGQILGNHLTGAPEDWDTELLVKELGAVMPLSRELSDPDRLAQMAVEEIEEEVLAHAAEVYDKREQQLGSGLMRVIERQVMLRVIDSHWVQHLTSMENLRTGIGLYAYGQRDPLVAYKKESHEQFQGLLARIQHDIAHTIYNIQVNANVQAQQAQQGQQPQGTPANGAQAQNGPKPMTASKGRQPNIGGRSVMEKVVGDRDREAVPPGARKIGRNELCPCGSGKKYKRCHGTES